MDNTQKVLNTLNAQFKAEYRPLADKLIDKINAYLSTGIEPAQAVDLAFKELNVSKWLVDTTKKSIVKSVLAAMGYSQSKTFAILSNKGLTDKVLKASYSGNETVLSGNLYKKAREMKRTVTNTIKQSFADKKEIVETSRALFDGYGYGQKIDKQTIAGRIEKLAQARLNGEKLPDEINKEVRKFKRYVNNLATPDLRVGYRNLLESIESGTAKAVQKQIWVAVQEKSRYQASVIAKTETAVAYGNAFESRAVLDPDVTAIKYTLSSQHKIFDICNVHTKVDVGYGQGVYPLNHLPKYPFHPNCTCLMSEVLRSKVPANTHVRDKDIQNGMDKALSKAGDNAQSLFTKEGYEKYKKSGKYQTMSNYEGYHKAVSKVNPNVFEGV